MPASYLGNRILFTPSIKPRSEAALEVAMLGHCPGEVRPERLATHARDAIKVAGFSSRLASSSNLQHVPIPLASYAEFEDIFPEASSGDTLGYSQLAGRRAWLPAAVSDFFANGGERLWVITVAEEEGFQGFFPRAVPPLYDVENLRGFYCALVLARVGLIALPDLERIQIAETLPDIPRVQLVNPAPEFVPCGTRFDDGHRERRHSDEMPDPSAPTNIEELLRVLLNTIQKYRPDMQCLLSMPLAYSSEAQSPVVDQTAMSFISQLRESPQAHLLRQVQLLFPYFRTHSSKIQTGVGAVAGLIAKGAAERGHWRSIANVALISNAAPFPALSTQMCTQLRESPGISVITSRHGRMMLDDERICVTALHRLDNPIKGTHSAEVVRFMGFLVRELKRLGEQLVFNTDPRDPRPLLTLEKFFLQLFKRGALRGRLPEKAFNIRQATTQEGVMAFDIEIAPAYPLDKIIVSLLNRNGQWQANVASGGDNV